MPRCTCENCRYCKTRYYESNRDPIRRHQSRLSYYDANREAIKLRQPVAARKFYQRNRERLIRQSVEERRARLHRLAAIEEMRSSRNRPDEALDRDAAAWLKRIRG